MSTNEKTKSVADALVAPELTLPRVLNTELSRPAKKPIEEGTVDAFPSMDGDDVVDNAVSKKLGAPTTRGNTSFSSEIQWCDTETLRINPLSDTIYGSDVPPALLASITENDIQSPLIVCKVTMKILSGNTRLRVAQQLSKEKVPVLFVDGDLTEAEEQNLVLSHNVARDKTNEMRAREYKCYLDIEKKRAKQRVEAGRSGTAQVQNFALPKSREIAAEKVGASHTSLDTGVKVVATIDRLLELGEFDNAKRLKKVLEENGYSSAKALAVNQNWLSEGGNAQPTKTRKGAKSASKSSPDQQEHSQELARHEAPSLETCAEAAPNQARAETPADAQGPLPIVEPSKVEAAFEQMRALEAFLRDVDSAQFTDEVQTRIGAGIGKINEAALIAGFTIKAL